MKCRQFHISMQRRLRTQEPHEIVFSYLSTVSPNSIPSIFTGRVKLLCLFVSVIDKFILFYGFFSLLAVLTVVVDLLIGLFHRLITPCKQFT